MRLVFAGIAAGLSGLAAIAFVHADQELMPVAAFLPSFATAVILCDLITAYLILVHAPLVGRWSLVWLGTAYVFSGTIVIAQMLVFPGVWSEHGLLGAGPQSAVWLWVAWHGGFPLFILASIGALALERRGRIVEAPTYRHVVLATLGALGLVVACELVVTSGQALLPPLLDGTRFNMLTQSTSGRMILLLNGLALAAVLVVRRCRTVLDLGLALAMLGSVIDVALTLRAGSRFSVGWYFGRIGALIPAFSVLAVYLRGVTLLYSRVTVLNEQLEEQLALDVTTGLHNRRHFNLQLEAALAEGWRLGEPTSLLLIDVDHFKLYNDHYGHLPGDECLRQIAAAIRGAIRGPSDLGARFGGEEFAVILRATDRTGAVQVGRQVLDDVTRLEIEHRGSPTGPHVTISIGTATAEPGEAFADLIRAADSALYRAKAEGRNRLV